MVSGCSRVCRLFQSVQAVPESAVVSGCSRVCRQWMQAVRECAGSGCWLFQSVHAVCADCSRVCRMFQSLHALGTG